MTKQTEALKLALEQTLEMLTDNRYYIEANERAEYLVMYDKAIAGAEKALAEQPAQQEPAYTYTSTQATRCARCGEHKHTPLRIDSMGGYVCLTCIDKQLCTPQAQPAREPLTDDELADLWYKQSLDWMEFARAIEAKLREKNQ